MNAKMLLGATLASMISACVVPSDTNASDGENVDHSLAVEPPQDPAVQDQAASVSALSLGENADATAASDCNAFPVINVNSYNGTQGQALCMFGFTFVPDYANQRHVFIIGIDGAVYHTWQTWQNLTTGAGSAWELDGGVATSGVSAGRISGGGLQLCVIGNDFRTVWSKTYFPSNGWGGAG